MMTGRASNRVHEVLAMVEAGKCVHWLSEGDWQLHELLLGLLAISGPADVYLSVYGFGAYPARLVADLKSRGVIRTLHCLIDYRTSMPSDGGVATVRNCADSVKLVQTQAKVTVIENEKYAFAIVGSANYTDTKTKKFDAGVVECDAGAVLFHKQWICAELERTRRKR